MKYALLIIFFWGLWGFFTKILSRYMSWQWLGFISYLGTTLLLLFFVIKNPSNVKLSYGFYAFILGVISGIGTVLFYYAIKRYEVSFLVPLTGLYILLPAILGILVLKEELNFYKIFGIIFAVLAIYFLSKT